MADESGGRVRGNNSSTSFCLRSSCWTDISIPCESSQPTTIWMLFFWVTLTLSSSKFYCGTDHRKCEIRHCGQRLFKLGRPLHTGFEPRSLAWFACYTGQSATTYTTVAAHHSYPRPSLTEVIDQGYVGWMAWRWSWAADGWRWRLRDNTRKIGRNCEPGCKYGWLSLTRGHFCMALRSFEPPSQLWRIITWRGVGCRYMMQWG